MGSPEPALTDSSQKIDAYGTTGVLASW